jgi:hypothetical protein
VVSEHFSWWLGVICIPNCLHNEAVNHKISTIARGGRVHISNFSIMTRKILFLGAVADRLLLDIGKPCAQPNEIRMWLLSKKQSLTGRLARCYPAAQVLAVNDVVPLVDLSK